MIPESTAPAAAAPAAEMGGRGLLARRASVVSAAVLASRVLGVVREQVFAVFFGAGRELDAFITAFRIPNLLRDLFAEGTKPSSEEIAARLGFQPYDTAPLVSELQLV